jgi:hypothetical protein
MAKSSSTVGPMRTQPTGHDSTMPPPVQPLMPARENAKKKVQPRQKPTRLDGVQVAKAKITRRNSLRKQRDALERLQPSFALSEQRYFIV